tara:strand:+ start:668 stop:793 length:126 start_codon:yes stop_codon:yes gene_type:complete
LIFSTATFSVALCLPEDFLDAILATFLVSAIVASPLNLPAA